MSFFLLLSDTYRLKQILEGVPRKKLLHKFVNKKEEERQIGNEKKKENFLQSTSLDFFTIPCKRTLQASLAKLILTAFK